MFAPLGGIGVVAPVPDNNVEISGSALRRGALESGDAPTRRCLRDLDPASPIPSPSRQRRICHV
jgi:hypothetical protein